MTATRTIEDYVNLERCVDALEDALKDSKDKAAFLEATNAEQAAMLNKVIAQRDELQKDADRYRFVRSADRVAISTEAARDPIAYDAAIDAAIAKAQEAAK